jgi:hypothetical protein
MCLRTRATVAVFMITSEMGRRYLSASGVTTWPPLPTSHSCSSVKRRSRWVIDKQDEETAMRP